MENFIFCAVCAKTSWKVYFFPGDWPGSLKKWSDLLFCGSIFIFIRYQKFLHMCYMGNLKQIKYVLAGGGGGGRSDHHWRKSHACAKWVTKTHIWAYFPPLQASHLSELARLMEKFLTTVLNASSLNGQTLLAKWVRGTCQ